MSAHPKTSVDPLLGTLLQNFFPPSAEGVALLATVQSPELQAEIVLRLIEENWTESRHLEEQRSSLTNLIVVIAAAVSGVSTQTGLTRNILPLSLLLVVLGAYGIIASSKLHERLDLHICRARYLRQHLDQMCPGIDILRLKQLADLDNQQRHPWATSLGVNTVWISLHILIAGLGVAYTLFSLLSGQS
jgi:hypothetical protein